MNDNPLFDWALTQESTQPDFQYFDEVDKANPYTGVRLIFVMFLEASRGSLLNLQVLMSLFSGLSLRETAKITKTSHENCRTILSSIKKDYPVLYQVIKQQEGTVEVITPNLLDKRYKVIDKLTGKESFFYSPSHISRKLKITPSAICMSIARGSKSPIKGRWLVYKLDKGE